MRILGPASASMPDIIRAVSMRSSELFITEMVPELWDAALRYYIDPVGLVAQSAKETNYGNFGGKVTPMFHNTCGLKLRFPNIVPGVTDGDRPLAHAMFPSWTVGAVAHAQHVAAYAGAEQWVYDSMDLIVDPRWAFVDEHRYALEEWSELGGKWAPSAMYGFEIEDIMSQLQVG